MSARIVALAVSWFIVATAPAQTVPASCEDVGVANCAGITAPLTDPEHDAAPARNEFQLTVGQEGERALLTLGRQFPQDARLQWKATVSSPLDESEPETSLATLDDLANGTTFELAMSYSTFRPPADLSVQGVDRACALSKEALTLARTQRLPAVPGETVADRQARLERIAQDIVKMECDDRLYQEVRFAGSQLGRQALRNVSKAYFAGRPVVTYGLKVGAGYDEYDFLDDTFAPTSSHETGYEVGVNVAMTDPVRLWSLVASVTRQRAYENTRSSLVQVCVPIEGTPAERCHEGFALPPTRTDTTISAIEWRWQPSHDRALSIRASYDHDADVTGVSVPIYLLVDGDGKLAGGVKLGWRSDTDDVHAGVFVSTAFDL